MRYTREPLTFAQECLLTAAVVVAIVLIVLLVSPPAAHAHTRHRVTRHRVARRHSIKQPSSKCGTRVTRYGGPGEYQGTAGAKRLGLPSNTRDLDNAGILYFAHRSLPFGTRVLFAHDGYQAIGTCVDRGPFSSAVYDLGRGLGNTLRCSGSDYVTATVLR